MSEPIFNDEELTTLLEALDCWLTRPPGAQFMNDMILTLGPGERTEEAIKAKLGDLHKQCAAEALRRKQMSFRLQLKLMEMKSRPSEFSNTPPPGGT